jgi:hypothetical protein
MICKHGVDDASGNFCAHGCHQYHQILNQVLSTSKPLVFKGYSSGVSSILIDDPMPPKKKNSKTECVHGYDPANGSRCCRMGCHTPLKGKGTRCEHGMDPNIGEIPCKKGCHDPKPSKLDSDRMIVITLIEDAEEQFEHECMICKVERASIFIVFPLSDVSIPACSGCGAHLGTKTMALLGQ